MNPNKQLEELDGIAIIGMAGRFPGAGSLDEFWGNLRDGVESIATFTDAQLLSAGEDPALLNSPGYVKAGPVLDGVELFDAGFFGFTSREAEITNPEHRIFLECAWEALETAGYDPGQYPGRIGVFAGAGMRCSYRHILMSSSHLTELLGDLQKFIAIEKDFLATTVSYRLNLKGPSISVQTACSTSLVAVHLGCQSLLHGDSDIVLAGGVSIRIPQIAGYLYQDGLIYSPDGHCRAFDAAAKGTIFGSGAGIVVLKRLADALSDGDCIHAVIAGSALNNDGALKVGYTAPSVDGQAAVIAEAQAIAGVTGDEITYVETHGTGTPLGDPIEVAALAKAFGRTTQNKGFCAIGSLKTNVGHLDAAAGVAGLLKVVLALENGMLPPSLNFSQPNPEIDFPNTPFYVQQALSEWRPANGRRVAGVSSFGIGGTNAHVIVEEAPPVPPSGPSRPWQLLPISAKTPTALEKATDRLAEFLVTHPGIDLADMAFTLQQGRKPFAHRRILAVNGVAEAIKLLQARDSNRVHSGTAFDGDATVAFMFPAQGAQYVNMGRDLYEAEPGFREDVDRCAEHLERQLGLDLRKMLYPADDKDVEEASEQLRQTRFTQPAVFIVDYALARLWMSWGVMPAAMVGHSLGEYVAATLSGVFDLEDALTLVAERGRLMQELPPGSMLAVHLSEGELQPWLREDVFLAAVNAPGLSVVSGPLEAMDLLANAFREKHVDVQPLRTSHAFHSAMMEPIVAPFVERVSRVPRRPPRIPFVSTLTGTWITADEALDAGYWGRQTRYGVRFGPAVAELLKTPGRALLEVGPGATLSTLAKSHARGEAPCTIVNSLRHAKGGRRDHDCLLSALGTLWMAGIAVDWKRLYGGERRRRVPLPAYPFERKRFWVDVPQPASTRVAGPSPDEDSAARRLPGIPEKIGRVEKALSNESAPATPAEVSMYSRPDLPSEYVAPQTPLELTLATVWRKFFGIGKVGTHDSFFDLGGDSLLAVRVVAEIEKLCKRRLPLATLLQAPTIAGLADVLRSESSDPSWLSLVPIRPGGSKPPLFLMHSAHGGNVLEYYPLASRLEADQPVFALQEAGLNGRLAEDQSVGEMATFYIGEMRIVQPHGPYFLGGFCFGGLLALEVAQQLSAAGEEVALLVLIQTMNPVFVRFKPGTSLPRRCWYRMRRRIGLEWENLSYRGPGYILKRGRRLLDIVRARTAIALDNATGNGHHRREESSMPYVLESLGIAQEKARQKYVPRPYSGDVVLFRAAKQLAGLMTEDSLGWNGVLEGNLQIREVPGHQQNLLSEPNVTILAGELTARLQAAQGPRRATPQRPLAGVRA